MKFLKKDVGKYLSMIAIFMLMTISSQTFASSYYGANYCYHSGAYVIMSTNTLESPDDANYAVKATTYHWKYPGGIRLNSSSGDYAWGDYNVTAQRYYVSSTGSTYLTVGRHDKLHTSLGILFTNVATSSNTGC